MSNAECWFGIRSHRHATYIYSWNTQIHRNSTYIQNWNTQMPYIYTAVIHKYTDMPYIHIQLKYTNTQTCRVYIQSKSKQSIRCNIKCLYLHMEVEFESNQITFTRLLSQLSSLWLRQLYTGQHSQFLQCLKLFGNKNTILPNLKVVGWRKLKMDSSLTQIFWKLPTAVHNWILFTSMLLMKNWFS